MLRKTPTPTGETEPETVPPKEQQHQYSLTEFHTITKLILGESGFKTTDFLRDD